MFGAGFEPTRSKAFVKIQKKKKNFLGGWGVRSGGGVRLGGGVRMDVNEELKFFFFGGGSGRGGGGCLGGHRVDVNKELKFL